MDIEKNAIKEGFEIRFSEEDKKNIKNIFGINDSEFDDVIKFIIRDFNLNDVIIKELATSNFNLGQKLFVSFIIGQSLQFISSHRDSDISDITFEDKNGDIVDIEEPIRSHFQNLFLRPKNLDFEKFKKESFQFFENHDLKQDSTNYKHHDKYFAYFCTMARIEIDNSDLKNAEHVLTIASDIAKEYEKSSGKRVHKAVLYYYFSIIYILYGNIEKAYLSMYNALREDQITFQIVNPNTQAYYFITLNYEKVNMIIAKESAEFVDKSINDYNNSRGGSLKFDNFRKILERQDFLPSHLLPAIKTITIDFTYAIIHFKKIMEIDRELMKNHFGCRMKTRIIFDLCQIIENLIEKHDVSLRGKTIGRLLPYLSQKCSLNLNYHILDNLKLDYDKNFSETIKKLLDSQYIFMNKPQGKHSKPRQHTLVIV